MNISRQQTRTFDGPMPGTEQMASSFSLHLSIEPKTEIYNCYSNVHLNLDLINATYNERKFNAIHYNITAPVLLKKYEKC